ncbi:MAG: arsenate reductase, partial [Actinobacteria bacterium]|nr:arsenate reductase [Actinomycetota bacterium]
MRIAEELGVDAEIVLYLKTPPDAATLERIIAKLEDPVTDLVRRDSLWNKLGLT